MFGSQSEVCNGADDDCDGLIDNIGFLTCGSGACQVEVPTCIEGFLQECVPREPQRELCDGVDNDCDGSVDNVPGYDCSSPSRPGSTDEGCAVGPLTPATRTGDSTNGPYGLALAVFVLLAVRRRFAAEQQRRTRTSMDLWTRREA
jgi:hypothetical protein